MNLVALPVSYRASLRSHDTSLPIGTRRVHSRCRCQKEDETCLDVLGALNCRQGEAKQHFGSETRRQLPSVSTFIQTMRVRNSNGGVSLRAFLRGNRDACFPFPDIAFSRLWRSRENQRDRNASQLEMCVLTCSKASNALTPPSHAAPFENSVHLERHLPDCKQHSFVVILTTTHFNSPL